MEEERQRGKKVRRERELRKRRDKPGKQTRVGKRARAKDWRTQRSIHPHMLTHTRTRRKLTHAHTDVHGAAGESEAASCGKELSGDIKQKGKTERSYMSTPSRTGTAVRPGNWPLALTSARRGGDGRGGGERAGRGNEKWWMRADVEEKEMSGWGGVELRKQDKEEEKGEVGEGRSKYSSDDSQHALKHPSLLEPESLRWKLWKLAYNIND